MERVDVELDAATYAHVRTCAARTGAPSVAAYIAELTRKDARRAQLDSMLRWSKANESYLEDAVAETEAAFAEAR